MSERPALETHPTRIRILLSLCICFQQQSMNDRKMIRKVTDGDHTLGTCFMFFVYLACNQHKLKNDARFSSCLPSS